MTQKENDIYEQNKKDPMYRAIDRIVYSQQAEHIIDSLPKWSKERKQLTKLIDEWRAKQTIYQIPLQFIVGDINSPLMWKEIAIKMHNLEDR